MSIKYFIAICDELALEDVMKFQFDIVDKKPKMLEVFFLKIFTLSNVL